MLLPRLFISLGVKRRLVRTWALSTCRVVSFSGYILTRGNVCLIAVVGEHASATKSKDQGYYPSRDFITGCIPARPSKLFELDLLRSLAVSHEVNNAQLGSSAVWRRRFRVLLPALAPSVQHTMFTSAGSALFKAGLTRETNRIEPPRFPFPLGFCFSRWQPAPPTHSNRRFHPGRNVSLVDIRPIDASQISPAQFILSPYRIRWTERLRYQGLIRNCYSFTNQTLTPPLKTYLLFLLPIELQGRQEAFKSAIISRQRDEEEFPFPLFSLKVNAARRSVAKIVFQNRIIIARTMYLWSNCVTTIKLRECIDPDYSRGYRITSAESKGRKEVANIMITDIIFLVHYSQYWLELIKTRYLPNDTTVSLTVSDPPRVDIRITIQFSYWWTRWASTFNNQNWLSDVRCSRCNNEKGQILSRLINLRDS